MSEHVTKIRLDVLLFQRGLFQSREAARRAIMAGMVSRNGERMDKPGTLVKDTDDFAVVRKEHPYVSRGGLKLQRALDAFSISLKDLIVIDVGASTGGFTDCSLQHGARHVYAVDVGYGQFAWKLRTDPRVTVFERMNFRYAEGGLFEPRPQFAVMDVSFISIRLLLPKLHELLAAPGEIVTLIKPQFEAGRGKVGKGGIVRDAKIHVEVLERFLEFVPTIGMVCSGLDYSPISGGDGNIEFLAWLQPLPALTGKTSEAVLQPARVVEEAWKNLYHRTERS